MINADEYWKRRNEEERKEKKRKKRKEEFIRFSRIVVGTMVGIAIVEFIKR